jgi:GDP-L-fucose synthase
VGEFYHGTRVLVAGGTGTIGIPAVRKLQVLGARVRVVSMDSEEYSARVLPRDVEFQRRDLTDYEECRKAVHGTDFVFNLVDIKGSVGIGQKKVASYLVPMLRFQTNLMEAAFQEKVARFLFVGSICEYPRMGAAKAEDTVWDGMPQQNDRIPGLAKRIGEVQAEAYLLEHQWDAVRIVRPSNVYGPFDDFNPESAQVIPALIRRVLEGEDPLRVWGDGTARRDFIYSEDLAEWMLEAVEKAPPCVPLNLGSGKGVTIRKVVETICSCASRAPTIEWQPQGPVGDPVRILAIDRARQAIGFDARIGLQEGIRRTISWFEANRDIALRKGH